MPPWSCGYVPDALHRLSLSSFIRSLVNGFDSLFRPPRGKQRSLDVPNHRLLPRNANGVLFNGAGYLCRCNTIDCIQELVWYYSLGRHGVIFLQPTSILSMHRTMQQEAFGKSVPHTRTRRIMVFLVESGILYVLFFVRLLSSLFR